MPLLYIDGFDHYDGSARPYYWVSTGGASISPTDGRTGGQCLVLTAQSASNFAKRSLPSVIDTVVIGMAIRFSTFGDNHRGFRLLRELVPQATVRVNTDGSISVKRGSFDGTDLATSATGVIAIGQYYYLEFKIYVHDSAGTYEVRVNDQRIISGSGVDTMGHTTSGVDQVSLYGQALSGQYLFIDDLYIDSSDFWGDSRIDLLLPSGAGQFADWTPAPSGTDNYANVDDDGTLDDDTTYNSSDTPTDSDSFAFDDLDPLGANIYAVAVTVTGRKDDAGTRKVQPACIIDSTEYTGTATGLRDGYMGVQEIWESPPDNSGGQWVEADINAAEYGYRLDT